MRDLRKERKRHRERENKQFILNAAENVFAKKGFALATMDDIAEAAQFSKATLYRYFKSKQEMFMEIIVNAFDEAYKNSVKIQEKDINSSEKLRELIHYILGYYQRKKNLSRIFIMEQSAMKKLLKIDVSKQGWHSNHHPQVPQVLRKKMEEIFNVMVTIVEEGIRSGEFREMNPKEVCYILGALLRGFHFKGPIHEKELPLNQSTDLIHDFVLHGIIKTRK
ncbi:MAG: TetR/AcrR family transcriptional regulator [Candidatus Aminicenantaceae bacterium]